MNRYPVWKYAILVVALLIGVLYTLPNFFGEARPCRCRPAKPPSRSTPPRRPASSRRWRRPASSRDSSPWTATRQGAVRQHRHPAQGQGRHPEGAGAGPPTTSYVVALNLLSKLAAWLPRCARAHVPGPGPARRRALHAAGRHAGGADQEGRVLAGDLRTMLREKNVRHAGINRNGQAIEVRFRDPQALQARARRAADQFPDLQTADAPEGTDQAHRHHQARGRAPRAGPGAQAEHGDAAQPDQRAGRGRAGDPAAGPGPHRGAAARRAGHGQGQGHPGPHRHAGSAHGRREHRRPRRRSSAAARCPSATSATSTATAAP
jgi:hypothetical protein